MKLNYTRTICIGLAFLGITAFWQVYDTIIPLILKNTFGMEETLTGIIMALDNILAIVLLPLFGAWSDKVDTPLGKRMPFIIAGTLLASCFMLLIPAADQSRNFPMFLIALGIVLISMGLYRSPAVALMPDLTPPPLRSQGNAVVNVMGAVGAMYALVMIRLLVADEISADYTMLFRSIVLILLLALVLLLLTIKEKKLSAAIRSEYPDFEPETESCDGCTMSPEVKRSLTFGLLALGCYYMSFNGVTTAFSRYAQEIWGQVGGQFATTFMLIAATAFISYLPAGILATRIGRKPVIAAGFLIMTVSFLIVSFFPAYHPFLNILLVFGSAGGSAVGVNIFPVIIDMCSEQDVGKYTGLYYTFSMSAQIATPIVSGFLMEHISYYTLFPYAGVFSLLGCIMILFVHHGNTKPEGKQSLLEYMDQ